MKTISFPYIASGLGLILTFAALKGGVITDNGLTALPLLTLLLISEFGFFVTAIATYIGIKHISSIGIKTPYTLITGSCFLMSMHFITLGIAYWPQQVQISFN